MIVHHLRSKALELDGLAGITGMEPSAEFSGTVEQAVMATITSVKGIALQPALEVREPLSRPQQHRPQPRHQQLLPQPVISAISRFIRVKVVMVGFVVGIGHRAQPAANPIITTGLEAMPIIFLIRSNVNESVNLESQQLRHQRQLHPQLLPILGQIALPRKTLESDAQRVVSARPSTLTRPTKHAEGSSIPALEAMGTDMTHWLDAGRRA